MRAMAEPRIVRSGAAIEITLTDTATNLEVADWRATGADLGITSAVPLSIDKTTLHGGRQEGSTLVTVTAGDVSIVIVPTRGMSVFEARCGGVRLGWQSPVDEIVNPAFMRLTERGGAGWLEGFNEMLVRCGSEWSGHPVIDDGFQYTLHGRLGNTPASKVVVAIETAAPHRITVKGLLKEKAFKQIDRETWAGLTVTPGRAGFQLSDETTNFADYPQPYQMIYHVNFGRPLLEEGAEFLAPVRRIAPFNDAAKPDLQSWRTYRGPTPGFDEMVYAVELDAGADGRTVAALANATGSLGVALRYRPDDLPAFSLWKNTDTERQGYVTGLEPSTNYPYNAVAEKARGRIKLLAPGETRASTIDIDFLPTTADVASVRAEIDRILNGRQPVVEPTTLFMT